MIPDMKREKFVTVMFQVNICNVDPNSTLCKYSPKTNHYRVVCMLIDKLEERNQLELF
jgi:hypothetical protein